MYLTTAIFLILLGSLLEYSSKADLVVYLIGFLIAFIKILSGVFIFINSEEIDVGIYSEINKYIPCELFFAIANSIKYVMVVYVAKWIKKSTLIGQVGVWFMLLGVC